jgi:hypothetical protein
MKPTRPICLLLLFVSLAFGARTPQAEVEKRIESLLAQMTLEEKLGQLQQLDGHADGRHRDEHPEMIRRGLLGSTLNVRGAKRTNELPRVAMSESRLKIPVLFAFDVIHGYRIVFPVPLGAAASFDPAAAEKAASSAAIEASAAGLKWAFAPMVDIARDPRWGRIVEGSGEDPHLGSVMNGRQYKVAWGGPPRHPRIDGSVVPCAAGGSLMFTPEIALPALREMKEKFGEKIYGRYGFADAFHPTNGWINPDVIGIDAGITLLSAENLRTGNVWRHFMRNAEIPRAMRMAGLESKVIRSAGR